ncbi:MAG: CDP-alcohol phosphatidyltransferase family protein [Polyangiaceae bacterium]|nr:CDP-alcohol phosphatidyltransferase family protein [Polyangiaceae bacterium]
MDTSEAVPSRSLPAVYSARDALRLPGLLSLSRLPLAASFPFVFRSSTDAVAVLSLAAASDVLDGWVARRFGQQSPTGAVLDGVMDKLVAFVVLMTLVLGRELSVAEAVVLSSREVGEAALVVWALALRPRRASAPHVANTLGKLATTLQFVTLLAVVLRRGPRAMLVVSTGLCGAAAAVAYGIRELAERPGEVQAR